jgi:hypothetical protein
MPFRTHRVRAWLAIGLALLAAGLAVYAVATWPSKAANSADWITEGLLRAGGVGALLSVFVLKSPRLAGIVLLLVTAVEFGWFLDADLHWLYRVVGPLFFLAGVLAESARPPDGHRLFVLRVAAEIVAVPLVVVLACVTLVWILASLFKGLAF